MRLRALALGGLLALASVPLSGGAAPPETPAAGLPLALAVQADAALAGGDTGHAVALLEAALAQAPEDPDLHFRLGLALCDHVDHVGLLEKLGVARHLREAFEEAVRLDPGHVGARVALVEFHRQAPPIVGGSPEEAARHAADLVSLRPRAGRLALARMHRKYGELRAAERQAREVLARWPESREAVQLLAELALDTGRRDDALALARVLAARFPADAEVAALVGRVRGVAASPGGGPAAVLVAPPVAPARALASSPALLALETTTAAHSERVGP